MHHTNVLGYDAANPFVYGNQAQIAINQAATLNNLAGGIARSIFIIGSSGNDVEIGWAAEPLYTQDAPTIYVEWVSDGADGGARYYGSLTPGTTWTFRVENDGGAGIWRFYFDGGSTPFAYSPTMNFNFGVPATNSEHYWTCDTLWAHFTALRDEPSSIGTWSTSYQDLECYYDNSVNDWLFQKVSNSEHFVVNTSGVTC